MQSVTVVAGLLTTGNDKNPANPHWLILCHPSSGISQRDWTTTNQSLSSPSSLPEPWQGCRSRWHQPCSLGFMKRRCQCHHQHWCNSRHITAFLPETLLCRDQWSSQQYLQSVVILWKTSWISREDSPLDFWAKRTYPLDLWLFRLHHSPVDNIKALWQIADVSMDSDLWLLPRENY